MFDFLSNQIYFNDIFGKKSMETVDFQLFVKTPFNIIPSTKKQYYKYLVNFLNPHSYCFFLIFDVNKNSVCIQ